MSWITNVILMTGALPHLSFYDPEAYTVPLQYANPRTGHSDLSILIPPIGHHVIQQQIVQSPELTFSNTFTDDKMRT
jgi:hypothetical protein